MNSNVKITLDKPKIIDKVTNARFGKHASETWYNYLKPYTPRDTGELEKNIEFKPFQIHYKQPYAVYAYYGRGKNFQTKVNPYATYEWDEKAAQAGQLSKLAQALTESLRTGQY